LEDLRLQELLLAAEEDANAPEPAAPGVAKNTKDAKAAKAPPTIEELYESDAGVRPLVDEVKSIHKAMEEYSDRGWGPQHPQVMHANKLLERAQERLKAYVQNYHVSHPQGVIPAAAAQGT